MNNALEFVGVISDTAGAIGGVFAALGVAKMLMAQRRQNELVTVQLVLQGQGERSVELPLRLRRGDVSRAEMLGRIGMLPMREKGARFSLRHLSSPTFFDDLNKVASGKGGRLVIPASADEFDQFDLG